MDGINLTTSLSMTIPHVDGSAKTMSSATDPTKPTTQPDTLNLMISTETSGNLGLKNIHKLHVTPCNFVTAVQDICK